MKNEFKATLKVALCAVAAMALAQLNASAVITLNSGNSSMDIDPMGQSGAQSWVVDGQNQLYQQWFWYGTGGAELSLDQLDATPTVTPIGGNGVQLLYAGSGFDVTINYTLAGGPYGSSTLNEDIVIYNHSGATLDLHFFQYSDFNLGGTAAGDIAELYPNSAPFALALQKDGNFELQEYMAGVGVIPYADHGEVGLATDSPTILQKLNDGLATTLSDTPGPTAEGDAAFAFQWDFTIGNGLSESISKVKQLQVEVIPEPSSAALALLGVMLVAGYRARRSQKS